MPTFDFRRLTRRRPALHTPWWILALLLAVPAVPPAPALAQDTDTLHFEPVLPPDDEVDLGEPEDDRPVRRVRPGPEWLSVPFHEHLHEGLHRGPFGDDPTDFDVALDYNRVDALRLGATSQAAALGALGPRIAVRLEYATGRRRWLYGAQLEQPLDPGNHLALGVAMSRSTDHLDLNQVEDFENSLALLFGRQDYRDYFEREGVEGYAALRVPHVTTASLRLRSDRYRSLAARDVKSWFHRDRALRLNPAVAEGDMRSWIARLERHLQRDGGLYHWIEYEEAGGATGGDFAFRRALADIRSVIRLSPGTSLSLRAMGGTTLAGDLPLQRSFTVGGVDGLRAHSFGAFRGNQAALAQAEYSIGFGRQGDYDFDGLHVIAFVDAGRAWNNADHDWDPGAQRFDLDGGFGLGTDEDNLRIYFARDLRDADSDFVISARLQRPF